ncbi:MAG: redoxin family protein [bacterium]|nr:redoxin family protein [bacterium]
MMKFVRYIAAGAAVCFVAACSQMQKEPTAQVYVEPAEVLAANDSAEALAAALADQAKFEDYKPVYEHFIALNPNSTDLHREFQALFNGFQRTEERNAYYKALYDADPKSAMATYLYGRCLGGMESIEYFKKATELDPDYFWGNFGMGAALVSANPPDTAKSIEYYLKAMALNPSYPTTYPQIAGIYMAQKNYPEALKYAKLYAVTSPDQYRPVAMQSDILNSMGDKKGSEEVLVKFAQAYPENGQVRKDLVELYKKQNRFPEAITNQHAIVASSTKPGDALVELGKIYAMANQPDSALTYLNLAADQGYGDYRRLMRNETLAAVRSLGGFDDLINRLKVASQAQREKRLAPIMADAEGNRMKAVSEVLSTPAPAFAFVNLEGQTVSLESLRGKVVVIDFWATWCGPCRMTMPLLQEFVERKPEGVEFISMDVWEDDTTKVRPYLADYGYTFNVLFGNADVASQYEVTGIPTLVIIDKDGVIRYRHVGYDPSADQVLLWQAEELAKKNAQSTT